MVVKKKSESTSNAKALFVAYQVEEDKVTAAREALEKAILARSAAVKVIKETLGDGPFVWNGRTIKPFKRDSKDEAGAVIGSNYHFREMGGEIQRID